MRRKGPSRDENGLTPEDRRIWTRVAGSVVTPRTRKAARVTPGAEAPPEIVVTPVASWMRRSSLRSDLLTVASRAPNGSSSSSTLGLTASALARATR